MKSVILIILLSSLCCRQHKRHKRPHRLKKELVVIDETKSSKSVDKSEVAVTKMCELKQGYLSELVSIEQVGEQKVMKVSGVFVVLNQHSLSLFDQVNVASLRKSIDLRLVSPVNIIAGLHGMHCFQVLRREGPQTLHYQLTQEPFMEGAAVSLCGESEEEIKEWVWSIQEFGHCEVRVVL